MICFPTFIFLAFAAVSRFAVIAWRDTGCLVGSLLDPLSFLEKEEDVKSFAGVRDEDYKVLRCESAGGGCSMLGIHSGSRRCLSSA